MPRRTTEATHAALLDAGRALLERGGPQAVTLDAVAKAGGATRQAVYLHFGSRAKYLYALMAHLGGTEVFTKAEHTLRDAKTAREALRALIELRAANSAKLHRITLAFHSAMHTDAEVTRMWEERQARRLGMFHELAARMKREKVLRRGMTESDAAELMWSTLSFEGWYYLVHTRRWPKRRYVERMEEMLVRALMA
jgi:AcrR family transcriptional regulator